jgi:hypothetical protein
MPLKTITVLATALLLVGCSQLYREREITVNRNDTSCLQTTIFIPNIVNKEVSINWKVDENRMVKGISEDKLVSLIKHIEIADSELFILKKLIKLDNKKEEDCASKR